MVTRYAPMISGLWANLLLLLAIPAVDAGAHAYRNLFIPAACQSIFAGRNAREGKLARFGCLCVSRDGLRIRLGAFQLHGSTGARSTASITHRARQVRRKTERAIRGDVKGNSKLDCP